MELLRNIVLMALALGLFCFLLFSGLVIGTIFFGVAAVALIVAYVRQKLAIKNYQRMDGNPEWPVHPPATIEADYEVVEIEEDKERK